MADNKKLLLDQRILSDIFPDVPDIGDYEVISNTFDTCTFRLRLTTKPRPDFPADLLIRLEATGGRLTTTARVLSQPFLDGTTILEDVWRDLEQSNQKALMECIFDAMGRLQKLAVQTPDIRRVLRHGSTDQNSKSSSEVLIGGPDIGYHSSIKQLLQAFLGEKAVKLFACEIVDTNDGIAIRSASDEIGGVELSQSDLMKHTVFCHNDLEPRNILVKPVSNNGKWYEVAAIIDWELAGFFPFAFESGLKDTLLGSSNLWFSWYALFKERTAALLPKEESHEKLIKALRIIARSKDSKMPKNVAVRVQVKWIRRERLRISPYSRRSWVREDGAGDVPVFTKKDNTNLELEVLKELGYI